MKKERKRRKKKTNDHQPNRSCYNDGLGVIKARRLRRCACDTLRLSWQKTHHGLVFPPVFLIFFRTKTLIFQTIFPFVSPPYLLSLSPCRSMTCCTEIPNPPTLQNSVTIRKNLYSYLSIYLFSSCFLGRFVWFIVNGCDDLIPPPERERAEGGFIYTCRVAMTTSQDVKLYYYTDRLVFKRCSR